MRAHVVGWTERATGDASIEPGGFAGADETRRVSVVVVGETVEIGRASIGGCIVVEGTVVGVVVFEPVADVVLAAGEVVVSAVVVVVLDAEGANVHDGTTVSTAVALVSSSGSSFRSFGACGV